MLVNLPTPSSSTIVCYYLLQLFENLLSDVVVLINPNANVSKQDFGDHSRSHLVDTHVEVDSGNRGHITVLQMVDEVLSSLISNAIRLWYAVRH
jgi:hypothetical protein